MRRVPGTSLLWPVLLGLVAAVLAAPSASAVPRTLAFPNATFSGGTELLTITTDAAVSGGATWVRFSPTSPRTGPTLSAPLRPQGRDGTHWSAELSSTTAEGTPAAPGLYDVVVEVDGVLVERCRACFTLLTRTPPGVRTPADLLPRVLERGSPSREVHIAGTSFADGTTVQVLLGGAVDPAVTVSGAVARVQGPDVGTRITRTFTVAGGAALGYRTLRFTNTDGRSTTCAKCLTITAAAEAVRPTGATDDLAAQEVQVQVPPGVPSTAKVALFWVGEGAPDLSRDLVAKQVLPPLLGGTLLAGVIDFRRAKPGLHVYSAGYVLPDGSRHSCTGTCRFSVREVDPPVRPAPPPSSVPLDPDPERAPGPPSILLRAPSVTAQASVPVSGRAAPGSILDLFARTSPATTYRLVRSAVVPADGRWSATVAPTANTSLYAVARNRHGHGRSATLTVRVSPAITLTAVRTAPLTYRISGRTTPRTPGQKVTLASVTAKGPVGLVSAPIAADGSFRADLRLPRGRSMRFVAMTSATANHAAGRSNQTPVLTVR